MANKDHYINNRIRIEGIDSSAVLNISSKLNIKVSITLDGGYRKSSEVFVVLPEGLEIDRSSLHSANAISTLPEEGSRLQADDSYINQAFTGHVVQTASPASYKPVWEAISDSAKDPTLLAKVAIVGGLIKVAEDKTGDTPSDDGEVGWSVPVIVKGQIAKEAKIRAWLLDEVFSTYQANADGDNPATITGDLSVPAVAASTAPIIAANGLVIKGGHENSGTWWVKDAKTELKLEVTATAALNDPVYLRWSTDKDKDKVWKTVSPKGAVLNSDKRKVTFDLHGVTALTDLLKGHVKQDLHFALAAVENTLDTTVPTKSLVMSIQQEDDKAATPATIASFDAAGKLTLTVTPGASSGIKSLKYATDGTGTVFTAATGSGPFTIDTTQVTDFSKGISVQATSNVGNLLTKVEAKIAAKEFIAVTWPVYANAVKDTKLTFNVGVKLKNPQLNLKLPVTKAIVHLPGGMTATTSTDFNKGVTAEQLKTGVTLTEEVTVSGQASADIKPARLELLGEHFTDGKVDITDQAVLGKVQAAAPVIDKTPGSLTLAGSNVTRPATGQPWWLKDISDLKLEVPAPTPALTIPVYLRWSNDDGKNWHNVLKAGALSSGKITFDLSGQTNLQDVVKKGDKFDLKFALATTPSEAATSVPAKTVSLSIQPEKAGWGLQSAKATFDATGKLTLTVTEKPAAPLGAASLKYSNGKGGKLLDATKGVTAGTFTVATTTGQDFTKGIFVQATSQAGTVSEVDAKIDPTGLFTVKWPSKGKTALDSTQSFVVGVQTQNSLLLPVATATVKLPVQMNATTAGDFAKKSLSELHAANFSVGGEVKITGSVGAEIGKAELTLESEHFSPQFIEADKTAWGSVTAKEPFSLVYKTPSVTNSDKPFVAGRFTPVLKPGETLSVQYKVEPGQTWLDVKPEDLKVEPDGSFRVYPPNTLFQNGAKPKISLRAKIGKPSASANEYVTAQGDVPTISINNTPPAAVSHAELKKGTKPDELIATVIVPVDTDASNPVSSIVLTIGGNPVNGKVSGPRVVDSDHKEWTITAAVNPTAYPGPFNATVHAESAAGVPGPEQHVVFADPHDAIEVSFKLDGTSTSDNSFKDVTTGTHTLDITIAPRFNLLGYVVDAFLGSNGTPDAKLAKNGDLSIVPSPLAGVLQGDLPNWNGHNHTHLLKVTNVALDAGTRKPQSLALSIPIAFNAGAGDHSFEIRIAEQDPTNLNTPKQAVYPVTFKMKHA